MTSFQKILANRSNAKRSTGPSSAAGRMRAKRNALKTGIYARTMILPSEDQGAYLQLRKAIFLEFLPEGAVQEGLAELIIADFWRLNRLVRVENEFIRQTQAAGMRKAGEAPQSTESLLTDLRNLGNKNLNSSIDGILIDDCGSFPPRPDLAISPAADRRDGNLLDAFLSRWSHTPIEDIGRQRRQTGRELLRNIAALDALQFRRQMV